jgi:alkanesulfonate monooxygenase SsuD/methylene tetrahydromethanopterin reductase-like flavin-dependent oxidoreductase (luciferase family)
MQTLGIAEDAAALFRTYGKEGAAQRLPDDWVNAFSAAGTPEQAAEAVQRWIQTGVDSIVFQPLNGDLDCLDEYGRYLMPLLRT